MHFIIHRHRDPNAILTLGLVTAETPEAAAKKLGREILQTNYLTGYYGLSGKDNTWMRKVTELTCADDLAVARDPANT